MRSSSSKPKNPKDEKMNIREAAKLLAVFLDSHGSNYLEFTEVFYMILNGDDVPDHQKELASQIKHKLASLNI